MALQNYVHGEHTKVFFGKGVENEVGKEVAKHSKNVLLHYDGADFIKPLVERVRKSLQDANVEIFELGGVQANPCLSLCIKGMEMVREHNIGFILSVGGGSTMDSGKMISLGSYYEGDLVAYQNFSHVDTPVVPNGGIITLPGTGAETSSAAVFRDDTKPEGRKYCFFCPQFMPTFAFINPELTYTLPARQTACGAFDMINHCMEDYFTSTEDADLLLGFAETTVNTIMKNVRIALQDPTNYAARANLCQSAYMPMGCMTLGTVSNWCMHNIEKPVTAMYHQTHGEVLAIIAPSWMEYTYKSNLPLYTRFCVNCLGAKMDYENPENTVKEGIQNLRNFIKEIGLRTRLSELGVTEDKFEELADTAVFGDRENGFVGMVTKMYFNDIINIYKMAL